MATNTYVALDKVTVGTAVSSITFSSINQGYTDLRLVISARSTNSSSLANTYTYYNNEFSGTNYSQTYMMGNGSSATTNRITSQGTFQWPQIPAASATSGIFGTITIDILNYSNTTTFKSNIFRSATDISSSGNTIAGVGLWRSTSAVNSIGITTDGNFAAGSTFSLYGVAAEGVSPAAKATGGAIYSDSLYFYHVFASTGTFTPLQSLTADLLVVAGGGGGGSTGTGGGGGAGGILQFSSQSLTATGYTCTVGGGGAVNGGGSDSQFGALTLVKGGGFGATSGAGATGGSGGGGGIPSGAGGSATSGQGYAGGTGFSSGSGTTRGAGGGGGAGAVGGDGASGVGGTGGVGTASYTSILSAIGAGQLVGSTYYIAGGGGGGSSAGTSTLYAGGYGGGGSGTGSGTVNATAGSANTGGGGGGGGTTSGVANSTGGAGGSGIVIVRYAK